MLELKLVEGKRLRKVVGPLQHIRGEATAFCNSQTMYLQASDIDITIVALLRFHSGFFNRYVLSRKGMAGVGILALDNILGTTDDDESITVRADCRSNLIDFTFENSETHETRNISTDLVVIPRDHLDFDNSSYEYEVVVGVPSPEFRRIFFSLKNAGQGAGKHEMCLKVPFRKPPLDEAPSAPRLFLVFYAGISLVSLVVKHTNTLVCVKTIAAAIYITASRVRFYTVGQEIVLTKQNGECIIGGVKEEDKEITILGSLHKTNPIPEASELCGTVWFLHSTRRRTNSAPPPPPTMINCPIGLMANLNFYFIGLMPWQHSSFTPALLQETSDLQPSFEALPDDLVVSIFSRLERRCKIRLQAVSKKWKRLVIASVEPREREPYHLGTGELLINLASFMLPGETVKQAKQRLQGGTKGLMNLRVLKALVQKNQEGNLFEERVKRLVCRGLHGIRDWTREEVLEAAKKF